MFVVLLYPTLLCRALLADFFFALRSWTEGAGARFSPAERSASTLRRSASIKIDYLGYFDLLALLLFLQQPFHRGLVLVLELARLKVTRLRIDDKPARHDYEYKRNGTANLFMLFAPHEGWRHVKVTERRTAIDYAHVLKEVSDLHFRDVEKIVLVQDNLNTHSPASLYEAFPPAEARRLVERFEWHYTPKHGSWLDMAESELAVLVTQCLNRRIEDRQTP